jgi:hypothetical protein
MFYWCLFFRCYRLCIFETWLLGRYSAFIFTVEFASRICSSKDILLPFYMSRLLIHPFFKVDFSLSGSTLWRVFELSMHSSIVSHHPSAFSFNTCTHSIVNNYEQKIISHCHGPNPVMISNTIYHYGFVWTERDQKIHTYTSLGFRIMHAQVWSRRVCWHLRAPHGCKAEVSGLSHPLYLKFSFQKKVMRCFYKTLRYSPAATCISECTVPWN